MLRHQRFFLQQLTSLESYREGPDSTFSSNGKTYQLDPLFARAEKLPVRKMAVNKLDWILEGVETDSKRVEEADVSIPILVVFDQASKRWVVVDGFHRLSKAVILGHSEILMRELKQSDLDACEIKS